MSPQRVVFDTNVLFSASVWRGAPFQCLELARVHTIDGITCAPILDELTVTLTAKLHFTPQQISETLADLLSFLALVEITGTIQAIASDPDDDKVIECALVSGAAYIVTGDRRHLLPLGNVHGITILDPASWH